MYEDFKTKHLAQKKKHSDLEKKITTANNQIRINKEKVSSAEREKNSAGYDLQAAKSEKSAADRKYADARNQYDKAKRDKKEWEKNCAISGTVGVVFAWTGIAPAVAAGLCGKYIDTVGDKKAAYYRMKSRRDIAHRKFENAERLLNKYNSAKSKLLDAQRIQRDLVRSKVEDQIVLNRYKAFQEELGALQVKIQTCKTQVDIIETRFDTVQGIHNH